MAWRSASERILQTCWPEVQFVDKVSQILVRLVGDTVENSLVRYDSFRFRRNSHYRAGQCGSWPRVWVSGLSVSYRSWRSMVMGHEEFFRKSRGRRNRSGTLHILEWGNSSMLRRELLGNVMVMMMANNVSIMGHEYQRGIARTDDGGDVHGF